MPKPQPSLAGFLSATIAISAFFLGAAVQSCPLIDGFAMEKTLRQPDVSNDSSSMTKLPSDSKQQSLPGYADFVGFGGVMGLLAIAVFYRLRCSRGVSPGEADFLNQHPQLEHPALTLTSLPKEALSSVDADVAFSR